MIGVLYLLGQIKAFSWVNRCSTVCGHAPLTVRYNFGFKRLPSFRQIDILDIPVPRALDCRKQTISLIETWYLSSRGSYWTVLSTESQIWDYKRRMTVWRVIEPNSFMRQRSDSCHFLFWIFFWKFLTNTVPNFGRFWGRGLTEFAPIVISATLTIEKLTFCNFYLNNIPVKGFAVDTSSLWGPRPRREFSRSFLLVIDWSSQRLCMLFHRRFYFSLYVTISVVWFE